VVAEQVQLLRVVKVHGGLEGARQRAESKTVCRYF
jgi:hypothetical protein